MRLLPRRLVLQVLAAADGQKGGCTTVCAIPGEPVPYWEHRYFYARNVSLSFLTLNGRQDLRGN